ncbi:MAG TPA: hypothetical protein PLM22_03080 [Candidatus Sabulitectum sp.]|nr:hypothetical protein [Candidatus Sabulitectum sp.]HPF31861.1 hypothetical protein [Candidatus Sabulitectum sp.]HPJ27889.1 hypothetical protein [Candidatus Sabulitectum sp.]HPR21882.1 hypothetical protein [Candidatus Sabulitectum sp.]
MRTAAVTVLFLTLIAQVSFAEDILPQIVVQEWGVVTWINGDPVLTSAPEVPEVFPIGSDDIDYGDYAVRAPVLYFNGPEFSGAVTVATDNGAIFDIYPAVDDHLRSHSSVTWECSVSLDRIEEYPRGLEVSPGQWNYDLWRVDPAMTVSMANGWHDKFLYYETAPETMDFLPYTPGAESVCDEYSDWPVLVIKRRTDGVFFSSTTLGTLVYGGDMEYQDITPDDVMRVLLDWSADTLEPEQYQALWNTWSSWILYDHSSQREYSSGMVLLQVPEELAGIISTISVEPVEAPYPVELRRYILVALPL